MAGRTEREGNGPRRRDARVREDAAPNDRAEEGDGSASPVARVLAVVEMVAAQGALTVAEVVDGLSVPRPSAHRIVVRLVELGFLRPLVRRGAYGIGPRLAALAAGATRFGDAGGDASSPVPVGDEPPPTGRPTDSGKPYDAI